MYRQTGAWPLSVAAGLAGTILFTMLLTLAPSAGSPPLNVALWNGSLLTLNLRLATVVGYVLEVAAASILAYAYHTRLQTRWKASAWMKGAAMGTGLWIIAMIIGLPLFDAVSPLVNNGLMLAPGIFAWNFGMSSAFFFLLAWLGFGLCISVIAQTPTARTFSR